MSKKSSKSVLDYDPLAWLKEADEQEKQNASEQKELEAAEKPEPEETDNETETNVTNDIDTDSEVGFGFFADEDAIEHEQQVQQQPGDTNTNSNQEPVMTETSADVINLGPELSIKTVAELKSSIEPFYASHANISLDASELQKIDTAGLQLLFSLKQSLDRRQQKINWVHSNAIINQAAEIIGMEALADEVEAANFGFFDEPSPVESKSESEDGYGFF